MIAAEDVWYSYDGVNHVLKGVSFEVKKSEKVALLGPNGSGKTTLAKNLNSLLRPTRGRVLVDGEDTKLRSAAQLSGKVGFVFQNPDGMMFSNDVLDEVAYGIKLERSDAYEKARSILNDFGMSELTGVSPFRLSVAQRKMLSIAAVMAMDPEVLVLDEPTIGQDRATSEKIMELALRTAAGTERTVVVVTHDMHTVAKFLNRALVLVDGGLIYDGTVRDLFAREEVIERAYLAPPPVTLLSMKRKDFFHQPVLTLDEALETLGHASMSQSQI